MASEWKTVPVEPTEEMMLAMHSGYWGPTMDIHDSSRDLWRKMYRAMLEAAPQPDTLEPVAWMYEVINGNAFSSDKGEPVCIGWDEETDEPVYGKVTPLYTHPPAQPDTATEPSCELCQEGWPKMGKMHYSDIGALRCKKESTIYTQCPDEGCPQYGTGSTCNSCKLDTVAVERRQIQAWIAVLESGDHTEYSELEATLRALLDQEKSDTVAVPDKCPQCGSQEIKFPRGLPHYCEDCGWPDEDFADLMEDEPDTAAVEKEVTHYVAVDPETEEVEIFQSIAASGGSHGVAKDQVHQRINEFVMNGYEGAGRWVVRGATVHGLLTLGEG